MNPFNDPRFIFKKPIAHILTCLLTAWIIISEVFLLFTDVPFNNTDYFSKINIWLFIMLTLAAWFFLCLIKSEKLITAVLIISSALYCGFAVSYCGDTCFLFGCCLVIFGIVHFAKLEDFHLALSKKALWIAVAVFMLIFAAFVGTVCCLYYQNYRTTCYDFGIFAQMFYSMKQTGLPLVTCERDGLLSHFAVHFSPIFYLLLPFYALAPFPQTLMLLQCIIVASGAVPLILICRSRGLSNLSAMAFSACYILFPGFAGGCFYYIHENNFLAPLILWYIYFSEKHKTIFALIFAASVMLIKEDAAVYTAVIALYFIFTQKNYKCNFSVFALSVAYFAAVTGFLSVFGDGVMSNRYSNYIYDGGGLFTVIKAVLQNPVYVVQQCVTQEKLIFILQCFIPLAFLPICTKKPSRLILLIPFVLVNIMTNYPYQFNIRYQYTFGSGAILIYLAAVNYADIGKRRRKQLLCAVLSSAIIFIGMYNTKLNYFNIYADSSAQRETIDNALALIPEDASVSSSTFLLPNLSQRDEIYQLETTQQESKYYVLDLRFDSSEYSVEDYINDNYEIVYLKQGIIGIFIKK